MPSVEQELQELATDQVWLRKLAMDLVKNEDDASDLVQETYAMALLLSKGKPVTRGQLDRVIRVLARRSDFNGRFNDTPVELPPSLRSGVPTPEEAEEREETTLAIHVAIDGLKPTHRRAMLLRYREGMTIEEVASAMGVTTRNVYYLLDGARGSLRRGLIEKYGKDSWIPALLAPPKKEVATVSSTFVVAGIATGVAALVGSVLLGRHLSEPAEAHAPEPRVPVALAGEPGATLEDPASGPVGSERTRTGGERVGDEGQVVATGQEAGASPARGSTQSPVGRTCPLEVRLSLDGEPLQGKYYVVNLDSASTTARGDLGQEGGFSLELASGSHEVEVHPAQSARGSLWLQIGVTLQPGHATRVERDLATGSLRVGSKEDRYAYWTDGAGLEIVAWAPSRDGVCHFPCVPVGTIEIKEEVVGNPAVSAWPSVRTVPVLVGEETTASVGD